MVRVLYFHQHFSTPQGATGTRSYEMARRLVASGHDVTMVCGSYGAGKTGLEGAFSNGRREGVVDGIRVIEFDLAYSNRDGFLRRTSTFLRFAWRSVHASLTEPADLVFATSTPLTAAIPGIAAKLLRGRCFVFEVRDLWPELPRAMGVIRNLLALAAMGLLEWAAYRCADRLIGLSPGIARGVGRFGKSPDRIAMIPNGCDVEIFSEPVEPWRPAGVGPTDFMAVFTGTHGPANGLNAVVDAAAELRRRGVSDIKLVLVGDGKEKDALVARGLAEDLDSVLVFHGPVAKTRLTGLLASADLGMQILANVPAFYYGTSPNKFFDYLAAGLPVLTNYPGWVADLITEAGAGIATPPDSPAAFADGLIAARDESIRTRRSDAARALAARFSRDRLGVQWVAFVTEGRRPIDE